MLDPTDLVRRGLTQLLLAAAAVVLLFEEWFWDRSTAAFARAGRLPVLHAVQAWTRARPRGQALALFVVPLLVIYPCKMLALLAMGTGHVVAGVAAFVVAKLVATALFARLYQLTEPAILQFTWVRRGRDRFLRARRFVHHWLNLQPLYRQARYRVRSQSANLARRCRAVYRLQNQRRCARSAT
jgi:hypothetical protein